MYIIPHVIKERTDDCFYICFGTGQRFSRKQWSDFVNEESKSAKSWFEEVRSGRYGNKVMYNVGKFEYNVHDVCINPNTIAFDIEGGFIKIRTSQWCDNKWIAGHHFTLPDMQGSLSQKLFHRFDSEEDAIVHELEYLIKDYMIIQYPKIVSMLQQQLFDIKCPQLTLF